MKFNEKLINLRKQKGLSQEELGYKLNLTRQTLSKWELGETTPEMSKLAEISKFFGVSVDSLLNEAEKLKIEDKKTVNDEQKNKKAVLIMLAILVIFIIVTNLAMKEFMEAFDLFK